MFFRKLASILFMLACLPAVQADAGNNLNSGVSLRGVTSLCLDASTSFFPCVSLTPLAYVSAFRSPMLYPGQAIASNDEDLFPAHLFTLSIKQRDPFNPQWRILRRFEGMDLNFNLDHTGAGMNLDMGGLEFNVFIEDGEDRLIEPRFFLGVDTDW